MKVKELIEKLKKFNPEATVIIDNLNDELDLGWSSSDCREGAVLDKSEVDYVSINKVENYEK